MKRIFNLVLWAMCLAFLGKASSHGLLFSFFVAVPILHIMKNIEEQIWPRNEEKKEVKRAPAA